jgi:hypothetical protein
MTEDGFTPVTPGGMLNSWQIPPRALFLSAAAACHEGRTWIGAKPAHFLRRCARQQPRGSARFASSFPPTGSSIGRRLTLGEVDAKGISRQQSAGLRFHQ